MKPKKRERFVISDNKTDQLADDILQMTIHDNRTTERGDTIEINTGDRKVGIEELKASTIKPKMKQTYSK